MAGHTIIKLDLVDGRKRRIARTSAGWFTIQTLMGGRWLAGGVVYPDTKQAARQILYAHERRLKGARLAKGEADRLSARMGIT